MPAVTGWGGGLRERGRLRAGLLGVSQRGCRTGKTALGPPGQQGDPCNTEEYIQAVGLRALDSAGGDTPRSVVTTI